MIEHINDTLSAELFKNLMGGKIINKRYLKDNILKVNPLYLEISDNEATYIEIYKKLGYSLRVNSDYYYLASAGSDNTSDGLRTKIIMTLLVLFRYVSHDKGYSVDYLMNDTYGLTKDDILFLNSSKYMNGLKSAEGKSFNDALNLLKDRNIVYQTINGHYVLTESGIDFFNTYLKTEDTFTLDDSED